MADGQKPIEKPRILFVDKDYGDYRQCDSLTSSRELIVAGLRMGFAVDFNLNLSPVHCKIVRKALKDSRPYKAMISHVPYTRSRLSSGLSGLDFYKNLYSCSLGILTEIKEIQPSLAIVAYSGADDCAEVNKIFVEDGPIKILVRKTSPEKWVHDLRNLESALNAVLCP